MDLKQRFAGQVAKRETVVGIVGLGYVGLPLALAYHKLGFSVVGVDVDADKAKRLMAGQSIIKHISNEAIAELAASGRFLATMDFGELKRVHAILICVPTPLGPHREPDLSYVEKTCVSISKILQRDQLIVLESTTYPGTSSDVMVPILEEGSGLKVDSDFRIAYSPEREDPGNLDFETSTIPKVVGADDPIALAMAKALYGAMVGKVVDVSSMRTAEAVKLTENIFRAVNIALVNELKVVFDKMDVDVWEVIDAAATKPFGFMPFYPGPGLGGHCIPIDPFYLTWKAQEYGERTRFIELAGEINRRMPNYVIDRLRDALNERSGKALKGAKVLIVGLAYKGNVDDMRESPSLVLLEILEAAGATVDFFDPYIPVIVPTREHAELAGRKSIVWNPESFAKYDVALVSTNHDGIDWEALAKAVPFVVDTRNVCSILPKDLKHKVVKA